MQDTNLSATSATLNLTPTLTLKEKEQNLRTIIRRLESAVIAYSGGVDSTVIAKVAYEELGENALLVIADSPSLPRSELADAVLLANTHRLPLKVVRTTELALPAYQANPTNRCYYCKDTLYRELKPFLANLNAKDNKNKTFKATLNGDHYEDSYGADFTHRPGALAAKEHGVYSPLRSARFTKADIRALAKKLGLPNADKPASPCLSSRIPTGLAVSEAKLAQIEQAEKILRTIIVNIAKSGGSPQPILRVRHLGDFAKIEVTETERKIILARANEITTAFKQIGFRRVFLSNKPFASGSIAGNKGKHTPQELVADSQELILE